MMTWILIGGLAAIALLVGLAIYAAYRAGREDGYEEGRGDRLEERAEEQKAGRHRMSHPRVSSPSPELAPADAQPEPTPGLAWNIDTVLLAPQPAPKVTGVADTGTLPRIKLGTGTTGEIRAVGAELIARIERGELV